MLEFIKIILTPEFLFSVIRVMTPILFAALACMVFIKGGIDPIGIEGIMLLASMAGPVGGYYTNSVIGGILAAILISLLASLLFGYVTLKLKSIEILAGIALNTLASGLTIFIIYYVAGNKGSTQSLTSKVAPIIELKIIKNIPYIGKILSGHNILTYLGIILVFVLYYILYRTPLGLRIRSVGENSAAAESVGINVLKYKYITLIMAGTIAGLGGAYMSMGYVSFFSRGMIAGRGFIGMAAEAMGRGNPYGIFLSSALFGIADSLATQLQMLDFPSQLIQTIPYIITILGISIYSYRHKKVRKVI
ncbi:MAG: ABC transporter permease [Erysipelotrichaceae bacterium]|nr:ABC transporter permease [Erysipelotrichaceae bacterium]